jgi:hypothetical protein
MVADLACGGGACPGIRGGSGGWKLGWATLAMVAGARGAVGGWLIETPVPPAAGAAALGGTDGAWAIAEPGCGAAAVGAGIPAGRRSAVCAGAGGRGGGAKASGGVSIACETAVPRVKLLR